jgi:hypothetical protein
MLLRCVAFLILTPLAGAAAERGFEGLVRAVESEFGVQRTHIPMLGFARFLVNTTGGGGGHALNLATFEDARWPEDSPERFREVVRRSLGEAWAPMIQVRARGRAEYTGIYCGRSGGVWRMIVATIEAREATVIELALDRRELAGWLREPASAQSPGRAARHGRADPAETPREQ